MTAPPVSRDELTGPPVLLCTDTFIDRYGDECERRAPGIRTVVLRPGTEPDAADLAAVDIAYFSTDVYPDRTAEFITAALKAENLRWFQTMSAGVDHPIFGTFRERGATLTTSSGASARPIARTVIGYLLALSRDFRQRIADQAEHRWNQVGWDDLEGATLGIVGMGPIGLEVGQMAAALGLHPIGIRRTVRGDEPFDAWTFDRLDELIDRCDALVLAVPLTPETHGIMTAERLGRLRDGALFVNVGRGDLVDEPALITELRSGRLGGAGLDVFVTEPLPADSELWDLPGVILTPHNSGMTPATAAASAEIFLDNLSAWVGGDPLNNVAG